MEPSPTQQQPLLPPRPRWAENRPFCSAGASSSREFPLHRLYHFILLAEVLRERELLVQAHLERLQSAAMPGGRWPSRRRQQFRGHGLCPARSALTASPSPLAKGTEICSSFCIISRSCSFSCLIVVFSELPCLLYCGKKTFFLPCYHRSHCSFCCMCFSHSIFNQGNLWFHCYADNMQVSD